MIVCTGCSNNSGNKTPDTQTSDTQEIITAPTAAEKRDRVGFGFYRMPYMNSDALEAEAAKGHVNVYLVDLPRENLDRTITTLERIKAVDGMAWLSISWPITEKGASGYHELKDGWHNDLKAVMDVLEEKGLIDYVLGFYFDEPLLNGRSKAALRDSTKWMRENYPELRTMVCFAINCIAPYVWSTGNDQLLDPDTTQYITDAAYDMYWDINPDNEFLYKKIASNLKERFGRTDMRIWYVPCVMSYGGTSPEKFCLEHLEFMYELLKGEENPGGLLCYAYDISNRDGDLGNIGFNEMRDRETDPWTNLEERLVAIGREIVQSNKK